MLGYSKDDKLFEDPSQFKPERWLRKDGPQQQHPFALLPFGFGPRQCYGEELVSLTIVLAAWSCLLHVHGKRLLSWSYCQYCIAGKFR